MSSQFGLLKTPRFAPFFLTQFLGAFNDNLYKNSLVVLLAFQAASWTTLKIEVLTNLAAGIFILPFFLFSATAGQLADKYDKARLARLVKILEMAIMAVAAAGFWLHSLAVLLAALFLLGCHSTLFGPVKYAILPQHLHDDELVGGNALVEAGTFVAILIGTLAGGLLAGAVTNPLWIALGGLMVAAAGYLASRGIPAAAPPAPDLRVNPNPFTETLRNIAFARENRAVFLSILGISWFWLYGALFLAQFPVYAKKVMGGNEASVTLLLAIFTVGIGIGSLLCERLSGKRVEVGLVPFGSIGLTVFGLDLAAASPASMPAGAPLDLLQILAQPWSWHILADLVMIGMFGGFFIVPLYALVQLRSAPAHRARIIAANNILNALFMVVGALAAAGLLASGLSIPALFGLSALGNALVALYIYKQVPEFLLRFLAWLLVRCVYRVKISGRGQLPHEGAALVVANHLSYADTVVLMAVAPRPVHFLAGQRFFRLPVLGYLLKNSGALPLPEENDSPEVWETLQAKVRMFFDQGEMVAFFPEGEISPNGQIQACSALAERLLSIRPVPVTPVLLGGLWGSFFSRIKGRALRRPFRRGFFAPVTVTIGQQLPPEQCTPTHIMRELRALQAQENHLG